MQFRGLEYIKERLIAVVISPLRFFSHWLWYAGDTVTREHELDGASYIHQDQDQDQAPKRFTDITLHHEASCWSSEME